MGVEEGKKPQMVPRMEGWNSVADEMEFEGSEREMVIRSARILHEAVYNRIRVPGLMDLTPEDVRPLDEDEVVEDG